MILNPNNRAIGIFVISLLMTGLYFEGFAALIGVLILVEICVLKFKKNLYIRLDFATLSIGVIFLFYILSFFWAVDRGIAPWGIAKFLPVFGFTLLCANIKKESRDKMISSIPYIGAAMTVLSVILQFFPYFHDNLVVNGRLGGFFEYPNTFTAFLMLGVIIAVMEAQNPVIVIILLLGMILSGSRTVLILSIPFILAALILSKDKKKSVIYLLMIVVGAAIGVGIGNIIGSSAVGHISAITTNTSTFWERVLYWKDALPIVGTHPFGMGYLGYYMVQASYATGIYSSRWVHNDLLQLAMDVGWIPAALMIFTVIRALLQKGKSISERILLVALCAHCMFDFDLQFSAMCFILVLLIIDDDAKIVKEPLTRGETIGASVLFSILSIFVMISSTLYYNDNYDGALKTYKWNTFAKISILNYERDGDDIALSESIVNQNEYVSSAWINISTYAAMDGDYDTAIISGRKAMRANPYDMSIYSQFFEILKSGYTAYTLANDSESARICADEIISISDTLKKLEENIDPIAKTLPNAPNIYEPDGMSLFINSLDY